MVENEKETQSQIKEVMSKVEKIKNQNQKLFKLLIWNDLAWDKNMQKCEECGDFAKY